MKPHPNPWPFGIILAFVLFIAGTAGLVVLACSQRSDLVRADYYDQEVRYQEQLDRMARTRQAAPSTRATYDPVRRCITVVLPADQARAVTQGHIHLYRPSAAHLDRQITLELDATGQQRLDARDLLPGLWKVRVSWQIDRQEFFYEQRLVLDPPSPDNHGI